MFINLLSCSREIGLLEVKNNKMQYAFFYTFYEVAYKPETPKTSPYSL